MGRHDYEPDDDEDESLVDDPESPDPSDMDHDDGDDWGETEPCPYCKKPVFEQAEICPHCNSYLSQEDVPYRKEWWIVVGVILCLIVVIFCWIR